ncbi:MAG: hydroxymethylbilane synthase, partial [Ignavibacteria bacterium]|nr:hydroxymethylbilane synthase [Ignavibacteria bacterium]
IEHALLGTSIDLAVHSLKDLPTQLPEGLVIGATCEREDVRDVFIPHPENPLPKLLDQEQGSRIATGSLRRKCQLLHHRPDFDVIDVRGNLNTRFRKLEESSWAGMILARAGVTRLGWDKRIGETVSPEVILPAVGQGALGIEVRQGDDRVQSLIAALDHQPTAQATRAERALLRTLEGGCQVPIGAFARVEHDGLSLRLNIDAVVGSLDGANVVRGNITGTTEECEELGTRLAEILLSRGADAILRTIRSTTPKDTPARV